MEERVDRYETHYILSEEDLANGWFYIEYDTDIGYKSRNWFVRFMDWTCAVRSDSGCTFWFFLSTMVLFVGLVGPFGMPSYIQAWLIGQFLIFCVLRFDMFYRWNRNRYLRKHGYFGPYGIFGMIDKSLSYDIVRSEFYNPM